MRKARFTKHQQIIGALKEHEAGRQIAELCRKRGVSNRRCTTGKPRRWLCRAKGRSQLPGLRRREPS
jgi:hypothetical protein